MAVLLAALSAALYGSADFAGGLASRKSPTFTVLIVSQAAGTIIALIAAPALGGAPAGAGDLLWGMLAGLSGGVGLLSLYRGLATTVVAIVSPVSALVGALVPMLFGLVIGEQPSVLGWTGAAMCLPAVFLLAYERNTHEGGRRRAATAVLHGLAAGIGFGGFFIAISRPAATAGLWPLIAARSTSISLALLFVLITRRPMAFRATNLPVMLAAGICDMCANVAFVLATRSGLLLLVTVITALYPGPTVVLARVFLRQRLGIARLAGIVLAVAGAALIGAA